MSDSLLDSNSRIARGFLTKPSSIAWYITSNVTRALMSLQLQQIADQWTSCAMPYCDVVKLVCCSEKAEGNSEWLLTAARSRWDLGQQHLMVSRGGYTKPFCRLSSGIMLGSAAAAACNCENTPSALAFPCWMQ